MGLTPPVNELSVYQLFVLDKIIGSLTSDDEVNLYEMVQLTITNKHLLPSNNAEVMETCFALKEFLVAHHFVTELAEMTSYRLTYKGRLLKQSGSLGQFYRKTARKRSFLSYIFNITTKDSER